MEELDMKLLFVGVIGFVGCYVFDVVLVDVWVD